MKEKIARWLRTYTLKEVEVDNPTLENDGIVPWDKATQETRDYWLHDTGNLLHLLKEEIEKGLLTDEEMSGVKFDMGSPWGCVDRYTVGIAIAQTQLDKVLKALES